MRTMIRTRLRPMVEADIPQIMDIERESFPAMWPQTAYKRELTNKIARYVVLAELRDEQAPAPPPPSSIWTSFRRDRERGRAGGGDAGVPAGLRRHLADG